MMADSEQSNFPTPRQEAHCSPRTAAAPSAVLLRLCQSLAAMPRCRLTLRPVALGTPPRVSSLVNYVDANSSAPCEWAQVHF